jgi:hypothetical protein
VTYFWVCVEQTRLSALKLLEAKLPEKPQSREQILLLLEDALIISFHTVMPPDRVGKLYSL